MTLTAIAALVVSIGAGCSKATTESTGPSTGPVTDSGDTGLRPTQADVPEKADSTHGSEVFKANCQSCHGTGGAGGYGPRLVGEKTKKDDAAAIAWIKNPAQPMPKLYPATIGERDVKDVAAYVESL